MENNSLVLTVEEAGQLLGLSRTTTYDLVRQGRIPSIRLGKSLRVPRKALEEMLNVKVGNGSSNQ